jgi:hypothetical protein
VEDQDDDHGRATLADVLCRYVRLSPSLDSILSGSPPYSVFLSISGRTRRPRGGLTMQLHLGASLISWRPTTGGVPDVLLLLHGLAAGSWTSGGMLLYIDSPGQPTQVQPGRCTRGRRSGARTGLHAQRRESAHAGT